MTGISPDVVHLSGGNLVLVIIVFLIALGALAMAYMFRQEVLAAGEGTDNMKNIAHAVQEGANAYLTRQFRTLGIFAIGIALGGARKDLLGDQAGILADRGLDLRGHVGVGLEERF